MQLLYQKVSVSVEFEKPVIFSVNPFFSLRSVFGYHLRKMCCIATNSQCEACLYNKTCVYSSLFETIVDKNNPILKGVDRVSHPIFFTLDNPIDVRKPISQFSFTINLVGKAIDYLPYVYSAFVRAGQAGLLKERVPFAVTDLIVNNNSILLGENQLNTDIAPNTWFWDSETVCDEKKGSVLIQLLSPLRFKLEGRFAKQMTVQDFFGSVYRRMKTLCTLYGDGDGSFDSIEESNLEICNANIKWFDEIRYSSRQETTMKIGGLIGSFELRGIFTPQQIALLDFAKIFSAGKNTIFGLGQIDYWTKF